jgi:hypothetical protein
VVFEGDEDMDENPEDEELDVDNTLPRGDTVSEDGKEEEPTKGDSLENEQEEDIFDETPSRAKGKRRKGALQIELDIEEESQKRACQEKENGDVARKKNPLLFKIYDERQCLKFKSQSWLK